jgi:hypothetical protein
MISRFSLFGLVGALAACSGSAGSGSATASNAVVGGGTPDASYSAVGFLVDSYGAPHCSAVLVDPRLVITAAHCASGPSILRFGVGDVGSQIDEPVKLGSDDDVFPFGRVHPDYAWPDHDIMYIVLEQPVPDVTPATLGDIGSLGDPCSLTGIGYGQEAAGTAGSADIPWRRHAIDLCSEGFNGTRISASSTTGSTCVGDSGGGLMLTGTSTVVGLVSGGDGTCGAGKPNYFTSIADHMDFIREGLDRARSSD